MENRAVLAIGIFQKPQRFAYRLKKLTSEPRDWDIELCKARPASFILQHGVSVGELFMRVEYRAATFWPSLVLDEIRRHLEFVIWHEWKRRSE